MIDAAIAVAGVAPFRMTEFRHQQEFEAYLTESEAIRSYRWLYEQSLASSKPSIVLAGTCGLCLAGAQFTAETRGGEMTPAGRVPHWREGLACDCERHLINRERGLLHYLLATEALQPPMRVLALGELGGVEGVLGEFLERPVFRRGSLAACLPWLKRAGAGPDRKYHLVLSLEQLDARSASTEALAALAGLLVEGGRLVFTAPFDAYAAAGAAGGGGGPIAWSILEALMGAGFRDATACLFWSEELGYLDTMNFVFSAAK